MRYNNLWSKSLIAGFALLTSLAIYWKKKRVRFKISNYQRNVLTLKQTVGIIVYIYCNNVILDYLLAMFKPNDLVFFSEELRVLVMENLLLRFAFPIFLIFKTKKTLQSLWTSNNIRRSEFYMTKLHLKPSTFHLPPSTPESTSSGKDNKVSVVLERKEENAGEFSKSNKTSVQITSLGIIRTPSVMPDISC